MYCKYCGSELEDGAVFCGVCGGRQVSDPTPAPVQTPVPVQASAPDPMISSLQGKATVSRPAKRVVAEAGSEPVTHTSAKKKSSGIRTKEIAIVATVAVLLVGGIAALAILKPGKDKKSDAQEETIVAENSDIETGAIDDEKIIESSKESEELSKDAENDEESSANGTDKKSEWLIPDTVFYEDEGMTISVNETDLKNGGPQFWVELKENRPYEYCTMELGGTIVINDCFSFPIDLSFNGNTTGTHFENNTRLVDLCAVYGVDVKYMDIIFGEYNTVGDYNTIYYYKQDGSSWSDTPHIKGRVYTTDQEIAKDKMDNGNVMWQDRGITIYGKWVDLERISRETPVFYDNAGDEREGLVITCEMDSNDQYASMDIKNYTGTAGSFTASADGKEIMILSNGGASTYPIRPGGVSCQYFKFSQEGNDFASIRKSEDASVHVECGLTVFDKDGNKTDEIPVQFDIPFEHFD